MSPADALLKCLDDELATARRLHDMGETRAAALAFRSVAHYAAHIATALGRGESVGETEGDPDGAPESGDRGGEGALPSLRVANG